MLNQVVLAVVLALAISPSAYAQELAACDLIDSSSAGAVLGSEVTRHHPNRSIQKLEGGVAVSDCLFYARKNRDSLRLQLLEYPSVREAERAFATASASTEVVKHTLVAALGEGATRWSIGTEAHGLQVRKGRRVVVLDTRWRDGSAGAGLNERLMPAAAAVVRKL